MDEIRPTTSNQDHIVGEGGSIVIDVNEQSRAQIILTPDGEPGLNYLCAGFKEFFHHVDFPMKLMAGLIRRNREAWEVMAILERTFTGVERNAPCPCGSGKKYKQCCLLENLSPEEALAKGIKEGSKADLKADKKIMKRYKAY